MKRMIAMLLAVLLIVSLAACGKKPVEENPGNNNTPVQTKPADTKPADTKPAETTALVQEKEWGVTDDFGVEVNGLTERYYINCPDYSGSRMGSGKLAEQADETVVVLGGQSDGAPEVADISELLPAYVDDVKSVLFAVHGGSSKNFILTVESDEAVTVGEYKMHKFIGVMELDTRSDHYKLPFVAYATTLKSNGGYAYWLVYDKTADQSKGDVIEEHADNMAKTFREEE